MDQRLERRSETAPTYEANPAQSGAENKLKWRDMLRQRHVLVLVVATLVIIGVVASALWWLRARHSESSDDAFIDARTVSISSQVSAAIVDVPVTDNQIVDAGIVLVRLDDRDFRAQVDQSKAQIAQAQASIANDDAQIAAQEARIDQAQRLVAEEEAMLTFAEQQSVRYQQLANKGSGTVEQAQQYASNLLQRQASLAAAQANAVAAEKQKAVLQTQKEIAKAQLAHAQATNEQAEANISRTIITAPVAGRVTKLSTAKGTYAAVGQTLMMFVPPEVWVTANFKETQLALIRPGLPVDIRIDAFPGRTFEGHVDSIQAGSGTQFSLLPAENATGNFVKIVQRVPVKITFDQLPDVLLGPGMSVVTTVKGP
jgi:membrane fusion protein, multidrug efflux system